MTATETDRRFVTMTDAELSAWEAQQQPSTAGREPVDHSREGQLCAPTDREG